MSTLRRFIVLAMILAAFVAPLTAHAGSCCTSRGGGYSYSSGSSSSSRGFSSYSYGRASGGYSTTRSYQQPRTYSSVSSARVRYTYPARSGISSVRSTTVGKVKALVVSTAKRVYSAYQQRQAQKAAAKVVAGGYGRRYGNTVHVYYAHGHYYGYPPYAGAQMLIYPWGYDYYNYPPPQGVIQQSGGTDPGTVFLVSLALIGFFALAGIAIVRS